MQPILRILKQYNLNVKGSYVLGGLSLIKHIQNKSPLLILVDTCLGYVGASVWLYSGSTPFCFES
jgi:hypothetical protein